MPNKKINLWLGCALILSFLIYPYKSICQTGSITENLGSISSPELSSYAMEKLKLKKYNKNLIKASLNNHIATNENFPIYKYNDSVDWSINPFADNTWLLYFHSLSTVEYLCQGYLKTSNIKYLSKALKISKSWILAFPADSIVNRKKYRYVWSTHSVANRLRTFTVLSQLLQQEKWEKSEVILISQSIYDHANWIATPKYYQAYNHGIIMDMALLETALYFPQFNKSTKWETLSIKRLKERYTNDISKEGVHLENSPAYHVAVLHFLQEIIKLLEFYNHDVPAVFFTTNQKMIAVLPEITQPNGYLAKIGDTEGSNKVLHEFQIINGNYVFIFEGKKYLVPVKKNGFDSKEAGISIMRSNLTPFEESVYLYFNAGYPSKIHKHMDNLSFTLFAFGQELLIDPGLFSYTKSPMQKYFRSTIAHNTISINGRNHSKYPVNNSNLIRTVQNDSVIVAEGVSNAYPEARISRTIIFIKPNLIILKDSISPKVDNFKCELNFNLSSITNKLIKTDSSIIAKMKDFELEIIPINLTGTLEVFNGSNEPIKGFNSPSFNKKTNNYQLTYTISNIKENNKIFTLIIINSSEFRSTLTNIKIYTESITYDLNGISKLHKL